jgi:AbrB family looped-hinge helix DNA binding protein
MTTIVTRNGQITIDSGIRRELGIETGTPLEMNKWGEMIIITKKSANFWRNRKSALPANFKETLKKIRADSTNRYKKMLQK